MEFKQNHTADIPQPYDHGGICFEGAPHDPPEEELRPGDPEDPRTHTGISEFVDGLTPAGQTSEQNTGTKIVL